MTCTGEVERAKGSSYAFGSGRKYNGSFVDLSTYTCQMIIVSEADESIVLVDRAITLLSVDNLKFLINITGAETATMNELERYIVNIRLSESASDYINETKFTMLITHSIFN